MLLTESVYVEFKIFLIEQKNSLNINLFQLYLLTLCLFLIVLLFKLSVRKKKRKAENL